ncbi:hypothetical protein [Pseudomonas gessardii]|uniref:Uncharacterized protein n=1 Tax=Pseudomonas gessardii TaxID=78544 RepID=A0A7Y1QP44_9PSED|nr:hypothetical protein [Pseudomonas gessardii]MBH3425931.1 hypothetical protein [Pseudomonas gessardii]MCF4977529.1 hypothetical protein [Pseudomonas gessardii]MCF4991651.1 hypothetical protein [Pseudomonas gessardii]MCF5083359.1 hypothetical protein [Pseudomonas gessardii]MCF5094382.1 hypothetical protein [Pseudomonas gessardii]
MSDKSRLGVGQLIFTDDGKSFEAGGGDLYNGGSYNLLVGGAGSGSEGGSIQLWFYDVPEFWHFNLPLNSLWKAEYIPRADPGRKYTAIAGMISGVVSTTNALAIVSFKFTARNSQTLITHEIEGFWHCNGFSNLPAESIDS